MMRGIRSLIAAVGMVALQGCLQTVPPPRPVEDGQYLVHVVAGKGETLPRVVQWYTGLKVVPPEITSMNGDIGGRTLQQGERVLIPIKMLKRSDAPPAPKGPRGSGRFSKKAKGGRPQESAKGSPEVSPRDGSVGTGDVSAAQQAVDPQVAPGTAQAAPAGADMPKGVPGAAAAPTKAAKTVEDMLREEQAEVERLKGELGEAQ